MIQLSRRWISPAAAGLTVALLLLAVLNCVYSQQFYQPPERSSLASRPKILSFRFPYRKILVQGASTPVSAAGGGGGGGTRETQRVSEGCSKDDIRVYQSATSPLPNGIPTYTVEVLNVCMASDCSIAHIHLSCGWFSSARLVNPRLFRRLAYNDCLLNDGRPLSAGSSISFQYANSFRYPLSVSSVQCLS